MTLYGVVASFWIDDVKHEYLPKEVGDRLAAELKAEGKPEQINVTFAYVSDDNRHNQAFVQHCHQLTLDYVKDHIMKRPPTRCYARSDGAPTQFANATQYFWIGLHKHTTGVCPLDWCIHCSCHGKDRVDPEMGLLKNMIRRHLLTETIDNAHEVRLQNYDEVRQKLVVLGADRPNDGVPAAGGVYRRQLVSVPAIGPGSARQNIPRGEKTLGAYKDRQFTDQNCKPESRPGTSCQHSIVRMRRRSCHFCTCCMRLDPCDDANGKQNPCQHEELCGPADNVVAVPKEPDRKTHITRSEAGAADHLSTVQSAKVGSIVAAHSKLEPEMWFLGEVVKEAYKPNVSLTGERGEKVAEGEWHVLLQKYEDVEGGENFYARLEEDEGRLHVKVEDVITIDTKVATRGMGEAAMIKALGGEEIYSQMTRKETRRITSGVDSYLPGAERERVWMDCP